VTSVRFFCERGRDRFAEYQEIKRCRPAEAEAIRNAITLIVADPEKAQRDYSIDLGDPQARYLGMPFLGPDGLTCLVWRHFPDGDDGVEIVHFQQAWGDDLDMPRVWPRD
jgi:hypothetical protein